jgi:hypothetical protein
VWYWVVRALNCNPAILRAREWARGEHCDLAAFGNCFFEILFKLEIGRDIHFLPPGVKDFQAKTCLVE